MEINISRDHEELGLKAAKFAASTLRESIRLNGEARIVIATGSSQFETLHSLLKEDIDWSKVEIFHLDEYIGLPVTHKASFRKYLNERFINFIKPKKFHSIETEGDVAGFIKSLTVEIRKKPLDLGFIGIGVNGHIAFNDPPADFDTRDSYIIVNLDDQCKLQQVGEGWFSSVEEVPLQAVSMTVFQIMQCKTIISAVPHKVKADAVSKTFSQEINNMVPATILKQHDDLHIFLDKNSAAGLVTF